MNQAIDFGYPWWIDYGHLPVAAIALLLLFAGMRFRWPKLALAVAALAAVWTLAAFAVSRFVLNINGLATLPTERFLTSGSGRVLDLGAGTGRSSIMVLQARPRTTLVALDLFGKSYKEHFGSTQTAQQKLMSNLKAAGVAERASIQQADMTQPPFDSASFDAIVSSYAVDHLSRADIQKTLHEASRVLKPGGEFLLSVIAKDPWLNFAFGPMLMHSGFRGAQWWTGQLADSGFEVVESGKRPGTLYLLARKR